MLKIGILTVSDRAFAGEYQDLGGPAIKDWLQHAIANSWEAVYRVVPDELEQIKAALVSMADKEACSLVLTTGGTGPAPRDVTPEATLAVAHKVMDGFGERMRAISLQYVPTAILSRQTAVVRGKCLIVNLPGQPRSIKQTLDELFAAIPYCVDLIGGGRIETHPAVVTAFRPQK